MTDENITFFGNGLILALRPRRPPDLMNSSAPQFEVIIADSPELIEQCIAVRLSGMGSTHP